MKNLFALFDRFIFISLVSIFSSQAGAVQLQLDSVVYWDVEQVATNPDYTGSARDISGSNASWDFDGENLIGLGVFSAKIAIFPGYFLFDEVIEDFSVSDGGIVSASSYTCVEGNFLALIGEKESVCGQYKFGDNGIDESSITYSGTTFTRAIGGDDVPRESDEGVLYDPLQLVFWYGFEASFWDGDTLVMTQPYTNGSEKVMTFSAVPIPAAAWLFGSALVGLVGIKRRK